MELLNHGEKVSQKMLRCHCTPVAARLRVTPQANTHPWLNEFSEPILSKIMGGTRTTNNGGFGKISCEKFPYTDVYIAWRFLTYTLSRKISLEKKGVVYGVLSLVLAVFPSNCFQ